MIHFDLTTPFSKNLFSLFLIVFVLSTVFIIAGIRISKQDPDKTPKGFLFFLVFVVDFFNNFIKEHLKGERFRIFGPYLFALITMLALGNTIALFGLTPPAANLGLAMTLSVITFFLLRFANFRFQGVKAFFNDLLGAFKPLFILLLPLNIIGLFSTPTTMGIRLFVNLFSGMIISIMVYSALRSMWYVGILAGVGLHVLFDIFFGLIQAFVFFMLSLVNLSMASATD